MAQQVNQALAKQFGLSADEYGRVLAIMGRTPSFTELGVFSVMWSEHCSYKSSRVWLKTLPTKAPWVIHGPGENAGVVDIGDGLAAVFKMESHNHPSFIEPYSGAATGVGGILRDVFTMGARPVANLNALRFGDPKLAVTKRVVDGVVRGIGGYGNCVGVPTVGGEVNFHPAYNGNPLVNAMTVGIADRTKSSSPPPPASATPWSMSAPKPAATASTAPPWPAPASRRTRRKNAPRCKSATRSSKNSSSKPAWN